MSQSMTKGRSTTLEERIEIVKQCVDNNKNYQLTAEMFNVSYQQVYGWVRKFEADGEDALIDKRGRNKIESELTEEDKIRFAMKRIEKENERLRAENAFLKKLQELEGRVLSSIRQGKKYVKSTPQIIAENILNQEFSASKPNEKWVTDVNPLDTGEMRICFLRDLCYNIFRYLTKYLKGGFFYGQENKI